MREGLFVIEENQPLTEKVHRLRLSGDTGTIAAPGQFVQLSLPGFFLRRPFSVSDWGEGWLSLLVERVGDGTACLHGLRSFMASHSLFSGTAGAVPCR